jgi:invasion protein IalB
MNMTLKNITAVIRLAACAGCITIVCLFIAAPAGHAQQPKGTKVPAGSSEPSSPERTAASFGDWILRCEAPVAAQVRRVCEVAQVISAQGQNTPIAQVAIGRPAPMESSRLTVVLPANVTIPSKPQIAIAKGGTPIDLAWQSCVPGGCLASATVSDIFLALRANLAALFSRMPPGVMSRFSFPSVVLLRRLPLWLKRPERVSNAKSEDWRRDDNEERSHSAIGNNNTDEPISGPRPTLIATSPGSPSSVIQKRGAAQRTEILTQNQGRFRGAGHPDIAIVPKRMP